MSDQSAHAPVHCIPDPIVDRPMTYQDLRMAVEWAASYRNEEIYLVFEGHRGKVFTEPPVLLEEKPAIPCMNPGKSTDQVKAAWIGTDPDDRTKWKDLLALTDRCGKPIGPADAVFWTPAAVEKFLVPYYASVYGDQAPQKLTDLIGILGTVRANDTSMPLEPLTLPGDSRPFAVAHMPKSEYVLLDGGMAVLLAHDDGKVSVMSVSDYVKGVSDYATLEPAK